MSVSAKKSPPRVAICWRKGDPFQGPKLGSCLTLRNELSKETHVLTKQETLLGKGTQVEYSKALSKDGGVDGSPVAGMILSLISI